MVFSNKGSLWIAGTRSPGEWPLPVSYWSVMLLGRMISESLRSPLCSSRLLQPCLPHNFTLSLNFILFLCFWGRSLRLTRPSFASLGICSHSPEILNDVFPCITSEGEWSPRSNGSKLGLFMLPELFSIGIVWKKPCPEMELHGKNQRAYHMDLCPGDEGIAPSTSPYRQWMRKVFPFLVRSQDMQPIGRRLVLHQSTSVLNGRLCPQPQWSHPQRKHWAPKHFQAVNSWILLTRGSSNI